MPAKPTPRIFSQQRPSAGRSLSSPDGRLVVRFADARHMVDVPTGSVQLVVTSPPYGIGLNYSGTATGAVAKGQIEAPFLSMDDYRAYHRRLEPVWRETYRTMAPGAYACINVACPHSKAAFFGHSFVLPISEDISRFWRFALRAEYRWRYVWTAMRSRTNGTTNPPTFYGSYPLPLEGQILREIEDILVFRKPFKKGQRIDDERLGRRKRSALTKAEWVETFHQVWDFPGARAEEANGALHPAVFPVELPLRLIRGYSVVDDLVLDPFCGTGTTGLAARLLGRRFVGYEIQPEFEPHIVKKLQPGEASLEDEW